MKVRYLEVRGGPDLTFEAAFFGLGCFFDFPGWLLGFSVFVYYICF